MIDKNEVKQLIVSNLKDNHFLIDVLVSTTNQIQVFVDSTEGLPISECVFYSRLVESHFDRDKEDYELSVSSGGLDLPFTVTEQFEKNVGKEVELLSKDGKKYLGLLVRFDDAEVVLEIESKEIPEGKKRKVLVKREVVFNRENDIKSIKTYFSFKKKRK